MKNYFYTVWTSKKFAIKIKDLEVKCVIILEDRKKKFPKFVEILGKIVVYDTKLG